MSGTSKKIELNEEMKNRLREIAIEVVEQLDSLWDSYLDSKQYPAIAMNYRVRYEQCVGYSRAIQDLLTNGMEIKQSFKI